MIRVLFGVVLVLALSLGPAAEIHRAAAQDASAGPVSPSLIEDLVAAYRILAKEGVLDAQGHVSIRHPANPNHYLMGRAVAPALITADDIIEYDLDSKPIDPRGRSSVVERFIHGEIYKARPDVKAVIHSHSPTVVPFSVTQVPLRPVIHVASFLGTGVPVWDNRTVNDPDAMTMLVRNQALGKSLAATLGDKPVALLRAHGDVVVAGDVRNAVRYALMTEINARMQTIAISLGGPISYVTPEETAARARGPEDPGRTWDLWKQKAFEK